jgi:glycosyltransferase involved in cell wall biosynthesis
MLAKPLPALWVSWERQRRNRGIAEALHIPLAEIDASPYGPLRYVAALAFTLRRILAERPRILFVQNPSVVLAATAVLSAGLLGLIVIVDAHNAAIIPLASTNLSRLRWLYRWVVRHAFLTIVSNTNLAEVVAGAGGRPFVLPDPIPNLPSRKMQSVATRQSTVLFICTFAADEPYRELIHAASRLAPEIVVYITGNPGWQGAALKASAPPNVVFTGFLPEADYIELLHSVDVVVDLTTRADCLVCGAYEGVAAGKPLILSDSDMTRAHFSQGVRYTDNSADDLVMAIGETLRESSKLSSEIRLLGERLRQHWKSQLQCLVEELPRHARSQSEMR